MADPVADASSVQSASSVQVKATSGTDASQGDLSEFAQFRGAVQETLWQAMELRDRASNALEAVRGLPLQRQQPQQLSHDEVMGLQMRSPPIQRNQSQIPVAQHGGYKAPPALMTGEDVVVTVFQSSAASDAFRPAMGQPEQEPVSAPR